MLNKYLTNQEFDLVNPTQTQPLPKLLSQKSTPENPRMSLEKWWDWKARQIPFEMVPY